MLEFWAGKQSKLLILFDHKLTIYALVGHYDLQDDWVDVIQYIVEEVVREVIGWAVESVLHPEFIGEEEQFPLLPVNVIHQLFEKVVGFLLGIFQLLLLDIIKDHSCKVLESHNNVDHFLYHRTIVLLLPPLNDELDVLQQELANVADLRS